MKRTLYILSFLLMIGWIAGTFVFNTGRLTNLMLIVAVISAMQALMICPKPKAMRSHA